MTINKRLKQFEKRITDLEGQVQGRLNVKDTMRDIFNQEILEECHLESALTLDGLGLQDLAKYIKVRTQPVEL